jgi:hypothetical protein
MLGIALTESRIPHSYLSRPIALCFELRQSAGGRIIHSEVVAAPTKCDDNFSIGTFYDRNSAEHGRAGDPFGGFMEFRSKHANPVLQSLTRGQFLAGDTAEATAKLNLQGLSDLRELDELVADAEGGLIKSSWMQPSAANDLEAMADLHAPARIEASGRLRGREPLAAANDDSADAASADAYRRRQYTGAAMPYLPRPSELFMAGKCTPGFKPGKRGVVPTEPRDNMEAKYLLAAVKRALGEDLYQALYLAISGATLQQIGEAAGYRHKPASQIGGDRVRIGLRILHLALRDQRDVAA